jgi:hypothetical protein
MSRLSRQCGLLDISQDPQYFPLLAVRSYWIYFKTTEHMQCFKKSFTNLKADVNLIRGHAQRFELSECSKTRQVLPEVVTVQCDFS